MKLFTFFGFRNGKLVTVVQSTIEDYTDATDLYMIVENPQDAEKQIAEWKREHQ